MVVVEDCAGLMEARHPAGAGAGHRREVLLRIEFGDIISRNGTTLVTWKTDGLSGPRLLFRSGMGNAVVTIYVGGTCLAL